MYYYHWYFSATKLKLENFATVPSSRQIIRGYNETISISVTLKNIDPLYDILAPLNGSNFNLTAYFANSTHTVSKVYDLKIDEEVAKSSLSTGESKILTSSLTTLISRSECSYVKLFCAKVLPAQGASFKEASGSDHINCIDITSQLPCTGE